MKRTVATAIVIAVVAQALLPAPALSVPQPPHRFYGAVTVGGSPAPDGLTITAEIAGVTFPYTPTETTSGGRYGESTPLFKIPADDSDTAIKEGGTDGDTILFYVEGVAAGSYTFEIGGSTELDLSISALPTLPAPANVQRTSADADNTPTFTWDAVSGAQSYEVRIDSDSFTDVGNVLTYTFGTVADGTHTFEVRAIDLTAQPGESSDLLTFTIDTVAPVPLLNALSPDPTTDSTPTLTGTVTDATTTVASVEYRVDGGAWQAATADDGAFDEASEDYSITTSELADGSHTIEVRATDAAGNTTASANFASDTFTVSTAAPPGPFPPFIVVPPPLTAEDVEAMTVEEAVAAIEGLEIEAAAELLAEVSSEKVAAILDQLDVEMATGIMEQMPAEKAAEVMALLPPEKAAEIMALLPVENAAAILTEAAPEAAAGIIEQLTPSTAAEVIDLLAPEQAAAIIEQVVPESAADVIGQLATEKAGEVVGYLTPEAAASILEVTEAGEAADILESIDAELVAAIIGEMSAARAAAVLTQVAPALASGVVGQLTVSQGAAIIARLTLAQSASLLEQISVEQASGIIAMFSPDRAAAILEQMVADRAAALMEHLDIDKLEDIIMAMSHDSLMEVLPYLSVEVLHAVDPAVLFEALPDAPTEQLIGEEAPEPAVVTPPVAVYVTSSSARYLVVQSVAGEWVVIADALPPLERLMIITREALRNIETAVEVLDSLPEEAATELPEGHIPRAFLEVSFDNIEPDDVALGYLRLQVEKDWLEQNSIHRWSIVLDHYDSESGEWVSLPTKLVDEDDEFVYYTAVIPSFSLFAISGTVEAPGRNFEVTGLTLEPAQAAPGQEVLVSADVHSLSDTAQVAVVTAWLDGVPLLARTVRLEAGGKDTVTFTIAIEALGKYQLRVDRLFRTLTISSGVLRPAAFQVSGLSITPAEVGLGDLAIIEVLVTNTGQAEGSYEVTLMVDGQVSQRRQVTLQGGETKRVLFTVSGDTVGTHTVTIAGLEGSFQVRPVQAPETDWVLVISLAIAGAILLGLVIFLLSRRVPQA